MEIYFTRLSRSLELIKWYLDPYCVVDGRRKFCFSTKFSCYVHVTVLIMMIIYAKSVEKSDAAMAESVAIFLIIARNGVNQIYQVWVCKRTQALIDRALDERKATNESSGEWSLTLYHCKQEYLSSTIALIVACIGYALALFSPIWLMKNHLPLNYSIPFLPYDGISWNWFINYVHQSPLAYFVAFYMVVAFIMTLFLINHSCWGLDQLNSSVERLRDFSSEYEHEFLSHQKLIKKQIKIVIDKSLKVMQWKDDVQDYLKFVLMLDFGVMSTIIGCFAFIVMTDPFTSSVVYLMLPINFVLLFVYCWLGTRVNKRIGCFETSIYDVNWYNLKPKQRKDVQLILVMAQNMKGYNGIFKDVNMETFMNVMQFTYSIVMLMQST